MKRFTLTVGSLGADRLQVRAFHGREAVSRPFRFALDVATEPMDASELEASILGQRAVLAMDVTEREPRLVAGIIAAVEERGALVHDRRALRLRLVPRLWLLSRRRTSRIFQGQTVLEIVAAVLGQGSVPHRFALARKYPPRSYCVQYQESDLAFVTRLCAEEGIWYCFEHSAEQETVVLMDSVHLYQPIAGEPKLRYREGAGADGMLREERDVRAFDGRRTLATGSVLQRDRDYRRPRLELRGEASTAPSTGTEPVPDARTLEAGLGVYEHHGEDETPVADVVTAGVYLEQLRRRAVVAEGACACARLAPGLSFQLAEHEVDALNGSYAVSAVVHEGRAGGDGPSSYGNTFACVPASLPLRPKHPRRRAPRQTTETAIVVGPAGQDIHTDTLGRVKVQFHWDLDGKRDGQSSCWLRVMQPWAGAGFGAQFLPRVGMEVLVAFEGGDTDRPVILGCLYNGGATPPFRLPTTTGIRTRSTPGGAGASELSFDDARGREVVVLRAQRDLFESADHDMSIAVGHDQRVSVGHDRRVMVQGKAREDVGGGKRVSVAGELVESAGARRSATAASASETIGGGLFLDVGGAHQVKVGGNQLLQVDGDADLTIGTAPQPGRYTVQVTGHVSISGSDDVRIASPQKLVLACGDSAIELTSEGVTIRGKRVDVVAGDAVELRRDKGPIVRLDSQARVSAQRVELLGEHASLLLDKEATLNGDSIHLGCDPGKRLVAGAPGGVESVPFKMVLSDEHFKPYVSRRFRLTVDGEVQEGTTDAGGLVDKRIPKGGVAVTIEVWPGDDYPTGPTKTFNVSLGEVPGPGTPRGAMVRLAHLGYGGGEPKDTLDEEALAALRDFQAHLGLPVTGKLDAGTVAKLAEIHGK